MKKNWNNFEIVSVFLDCPCLLVLCSALCGVGADSRRCCQLCMSLCGPDVSSDLWRELLALLQVLCLLRAAARTSLCNQRRRRRRHSLSPRSFSSTSCFDDGIVQTRTSTVIRFHGAVGAAVVHISVLARTNRVQEHEWQSANFTAWYIQQILDDLSYSTRCQNNSIVWHAQSVFFSFGNTQFSSVRFRDCEVKQDASNSAIHALQGAL